MSLSRASRPTDPRFERQRSGLEEPQGPLYLLVSRPTGNNDNLKKATLASLLIILVMIWAPLPATQIETVTHAKNDEPVIVRINPPKPPPEEVVTLNIQEKSQKPSPYVHETPMPELNPISHLEDDDIAIHPGMEWPVQNPEFVSNPNEPIPHWKEGLEPPVITYRQKPHYPRPARQAGVEGYVLVEAVLALDGTIRDIRFIRKLGKGRFGFEEAARQALSQWRFIPGRLNHRPVNVLMTLRIDFRLQ